MRTSRTTAHLAAALAGAAAFAPRMALASNPLEYPDNGTAQFSRGGAWLALANEPIATHYNPAALTIQGSGFSIEQNLNFNTVCYNRFGPGHAAETAVTGGALLYTPVCNSKASFPATIPAISLSWRATDKLGFGFAIVPPSVYGNADGNFPPLAKGYNTTTGQYNLIPASYRYQALNNLSTILFPTIGFGYEVLPNFRVGAAFISGIEIFDTSIAGELNQTKLPGQVYADNAGNDSLSTLKTKDLFVPGAILSLLWSPVPQVDIAAWGRWISDGHATQGTLQTTTGPYDFSGTDTALTPTCQAKPPGVPSCANGTAVVNQFSSSDSHHTFQNFRFPFPPEVRVGVRFHVPRSMADDRQARAAVSAGAAGRGSAGFRKTDPLHSELFDIELDGSYALNSDANTITVRFAEAADGGGVAHVQPNGLVPPNADKWNGYINSFGLRLGGQYNVIQDKLGIRAGTWFESRSQDPAWLSVFPVGGTRGGFGGGIVFRQDFVDISMGYQYNWSLGLDNNGVGAMKAVVGSGGIGSTPFSTHAETGTSAANYTQFRTVQSVNDGSVSQHAHAFSLGGTIHF